LSNKVVEGPSNVIEKRLDIEIIEAIKPKLVGPNDEEVNKVDIATNGINISRPPKICVIIFSIVFY
jgi:hypothetical protein